MEQRLQRPISNSHGHTDSNDHSFLHGNGDGDNVHRYRDGHDADRYGDDLGPNADRHADARDQPAFYHARNAGRIRRTRG
jgi:hypothetical protein